MFLEYCKGLWRFHQNWVTASCFLFRLHSTTSLFSHQRLFLLLELHWLQIHSLQHTMCLFTVIKLLSHRDADDDLLIALHFPSFEPGQVYCADISLLRLNGARQSLLLKSLWQRQLQIWASVFSLNPLGLFLRFFFFVSMLVRVAEGGGSGDLSGGNRSETVFVLGVQSEAEQEDLGQNPATDLPLCPPC